MATSAALGFPIAAAGTLGYVIAGWNLPALAEVPHMFGFIHLPALLSVSAASVITAPFGAKVAHSINTGPLKKVFACNLLILASYMAYKAISTL